MWVGVVMNKLESEKVGKMSTPLLFQFLFKPVLLVLQLLVFFFFYCMHKYPAVLAALDGWTGYLGVVLQSSNCWALKAILRGQSRCKRLQLLICAQNSTKVAMVTVGKAFGPRKWKRFSHSWVEIYWGSFKFQSEWRDSRQSALIKVK